MTPDQLRDAFDRFDLWSEVQKMKEARNRVDMLAAAEAIVKILDGYERKLREDQS